MKAFARLSWWVQWLCVSALALLLYAPILGNSFVADDYIVLKKVCLDKQLNTNGFFRPLSDITLYINFLLGGLRPLGYYLWNILFHAFDTVLLFHFCLRWKWTSEADRQLLMASVSALFFLTYPFHSEPVVWILGRAALMGNTFGILALVIMVSNMSELPKIALVALCYFIGMAGYESVIVLPAMVFVWLLPQRLSIKRYLLWIGIMGFTLVLHMVVRVWVSGSITGTYGAGFLKWSALGILAKAGKVMWRLFLPPMQGVKTMTALFLLLAIIVIMLLTAVWKKIGNDRNKVFFFFQLIAMLLVALLIPFLSGVSTHTSESDRFLHFPSFFFCSLIGYCLANMLLNKRILVVIITGILAYNILFIEITNRNWQKASMAVKGILQIIHAHTGKRIYIMNLPEEIDGAFVFRSGFKEALLLNKLDTASITLVNIIKRSDPVLPPEAIAPRPGEIVVYWDNNNWRIR